MKKIIFITFFVMIICTGNVFAQFGVNVGYSLNSMNYSEFGGKQNMNGFLAGLTYDLRIKQSDWYIFSGLNYSQYGRTNTEQKPLGRWKYSYRHSFLEMPIHAAFVMEVLDDMKISLSAGPKFSYALLGTQTVKPPDANETKINIYDKNTSPFNVLLGFDIGAQYKHFRFRIGYDAGILNQSSKIDTKANRSGISLSLGYIF
ncbi:MAG: PorT family protein [Paludibacter sp.]|nr:PorT family protein [Paludibacter sp.]